MKLIIAQAICYNVHHSKAAHEFEKIRTDFLDEWKLCRKEHKEINKIPDIENLRFKPQDFKQCDAVPMLLEQFSRDLNVKF